MSTTRSLVRPLAALLLMAAVAVAAPQAAAAQSGATSTVFINEFHYDNVSTDTGEFIEIAGPAGTDLTGWSLVLYNGNGGGSYNTTALSGTLTDDSNGYGFLAVDYPSNGIQNGGPDGMALVQGTTVVQFLSYEGSFMATDGPANGQDSTDIGVFEPNNSPVGSSLQLTGSGTVAGDFTWAVTDVNTSGAVNTDQGFTSEPTPPSVTINEIDYDQAGTDTAEFIELYNSGGEADLTGWSAQLINGAGGGAAVYNTIALSGALAPGGFLVVCANAVTVDNCDLDESPDTNFIQNGAPDAVVLRDSSDAIVDAVSYEGSVPGFVEGSGDGLFDDPDAGARSISRLPDGADTDQNNVDFGLACATPGRANADVSTGCGDPVFIHEIQGSDEVSPLVGRDVTIEGVVVGDYEGPSPALRGFYVQEEDSDADGDPATSEGIFVFHGNENTVNLGDQVRLTGTVAEFQGQTQIGFPSELAVNSSGSTVTPAEIKLPLTAANDLEAVEGMLVEASQTLYVTEFFQLGRFGQVVVSSGDRLTQPTAIAEPGPDSQAVQAANDLNRLIVDDTLNDQNPDPIIFGRDGNELTAENTLRGGDTLTGATGVLTYTWAGNSASGNAYRLRPAATGETFTFDAANPRPSGPPDVGGSIQVASFNVLNYFTTIDFSDVCGPTQDQDCRGADTELEFDRQRVKLLEALVKLDADVVGLVEVENTPGANPEADLASGLNDRLGAGTWAHIDAAAVGGGVVGPDTIRVGMIYRPGAVTPVGDPALLDFSLDPLGQDRSRTAVAQTFIENTTGEVFTAVVNHFKSKSGSEIDDSGGQCSIDPTYPDCDQGDGAGYFNATRTAHATELAAWLEGDPTGSGDDDVLILGDLNAYAMEDPVDVLKGAGYVDLTPNDYSFVFDGQWGSLDYALASPSLLPDVSGAGHYHINADEPSALDYNTDFKSANHVEILFAPDEFRTSDHDPTLVGLDLGPTGFEGVPRPDTLWPPNHKYRRIKVRATGSSAPMTVEILSIESSEADSGLGRGDRPNDIVIISANRAKLRAERFSRDGRVYTLFLRISDGSQTQFTTSEVTVPHNRGRGRKGGRR